MANFYSRLISSVKEKGKNMEAEMSFFEHLEALRWHLIRVAIAVLVFTIVAFTYYDKIFDGIIMGPTHTYFLTYKLIYHGGLFLQNLTHWVNAKDFKVENINVNLINTDMAGQFTLQLNSSIMIGLILGIPYVFYEIWRFIKPALHDKERKAARGFVGYASMLFFLGVIFGYFIVTPLSIKFLSGYIVSTRITNYFSIDSYITLVATLVLAGGIVFELPIIVYIFASLGFLTPKFMRKYRRHAIIVILMIAAVITPTPDALTMTVVAMPLFILYELSITVAGVVERRRAKKAEEDGLTVV